MNQTKPTLTEDEAKARRALLARIYYLLLKTFAAEQPNQTEPIQTTNIERNN